MDPRIVECPGRIQFRDMMEHRVVQGQKYPVKYQCTSLRLDINQINGSSRFSSISKFIFRGEEAYEYLRDKHQYLQWIIIYPVTMFCKLVDTWYSAHSEQRRPLSGSDTYLLGHVASAGGDSPGVVWLLRI